MLSLIILTSMPWINLPTSSKDSGSYGDALMKAEMSSFGLFLSKVATLADLLARSPCLLHHLS